MRTLDTYRGVKGDPLKRFCHIWKAVFNLYKSGLLSLENKIWCLVFLKAQSWGQYFSQPTQPLLVELSRGKG